MQQQQQQQASSSSSSASASSSTIAVAASSAATALTTREDGPPAATASTTTTNDATPSSPSTSAAASEIATPASVSTPTTSASATRTPTGKERAGDAGSPVATVTRTKRQRSSEMLVASPSGGGASAAGAATVETSPSASKAQRRSASASASASSSAAIASSPKRSPSPSRRASGAAAGSPKALAGSSSTTNGSRSPKGALTGNGKERDVLRDIPDESAASSSTAAPSQLSQSNSAGDVSGGADASAGTAAVPTGDDESFTSLGPDVAMEDLSGADTSGGSTSLPGSFSYHTDSSVGLQQSSTVSRGVFHQCGTARRVKVYELQGEVWHDRGTGFCAGVYDEGHDEALLVARSEQACAVIPLASAQEGQEAQTEQQQQQQQAEGEQPQHFVLVVTPTLDGDDVLLKTTVVREDVYQRQQDTLVVWTEPTGVDMALSFQEADGCHEIWEFLTEVQKHFILNGPGPGGADGAMSDSPPLTPNTGSSPGPGMHGMGADSLVMADGAPFYLPDPQLGNLELVEVTLKDAASRGPHARERVASWMLRSGFLGKLIPVFNDAEDLEQLPALHHLCGITQTALMLNDHALLDNILQDDVFLGVVGMLEYDPEFPRLKANYRDFLQNTTKFRSVVDIGDPTILTKIHQTYRLSYLKDVILARVLDDPMFSVLNSFIFFHQVDIVGFCSTSEQFLAQLFAIYGIRHSGDDTLDGGRTSRVGHHTTATTEEEDADADEATVAQRNVKREEGVIFLQQLCAMGKQVQLPARIALYRTLTEWGLLSVLEWALQRSLSTRLRNAAAEVLLTIIEYDANSVRTHILAQNEAEKRPLSELLIACLHEEEDLGFKTQMAEAMRVLLDTALEGSMGGGSAVAQTLAAAAAASGGRPKDEADRFLTFFYDNGVERLFAPLFTLPKFKELEPKAYVDLVPRSRSALFGHLCDLLCYVMTNHTFRSQYFVITSEIALRVASLLCAREKHMRLAALRFFRACLARNNQFINRHFVKTELLGAIVDVVEREERRDNLVTAACLDFFFAIRKDNMKHLIHNVMDKHGDRVKALANAPIVGTGFQALILQHEKNIEPMPAAAADTSASMTVEAERQRRQRDLARRGANAATMDSDEESYFNEDDDDETPATSVAAPTMGMSSSLSLESGLVQRAGLVAYADEDADADLSNTAFKPLPSGPNGAEAPSASSSTLAEAAPAADSGSTLGLSFPQKRRRDDEAEEEDDMMTRLAKRKASSGGGDDEEGGFVRETPVGAAAAAADKPTSATAASGPAKKMKISIGGLSSKKLAGELPAVAAAKEVTAEAPASGVVAAASEPAPQPPASAEAPASVAVAAAEGAAQPQPSLPPTSS